MKKLFVFLIAAMLLAICSSAQGAVTIDLYVDSAPNAYVAGTGFGAWWNTAKGDIVAGTFQNMRSGTYPGQLKTNPVDLTVCSFPDYGRRLHWMFWAPSITQSEFINLNVEIKMLWDQFGTEYTYDWANMDVPVLNTPAAGWSATEYYAEVYSGGVIGFFGDANWGAYGYTQDTYEARQAFNQDLGVYLGAQAYFEGLIGWTGSPPQQTGIRVAISPEPTSVMFLGTSLLGLVGYRLRRRKR